MLILWNGFDQKGPNSPNTGFLRKKGKMKVRNITRAITNLLSVGKQTNLSGVILT